MTNANLKTYPTVVLPDKAAEQYRAINSYMYPYNSGLWVKAFDLNQLGAAHLYHSDEVDKYNLAAQYDSIANAPMEHVQALIEVVVDAELTLHIDESIMWYFITELPFHPIESHVARRVYERLWEETEEAEGHAVKAYKAIHACLFKSDWGRSVRYYANIAPTEPNLDAAIAHASTSNSYPAVVGIYGNLFLIFWTNE